MEKGLAGRRFNTLSEAGYILHYYIACHLPMVNGAMLLVIFGVACIEEDMHEDIQHICSLVAQYFSSNVAAG